MICGCFSVKFMKYTTIDGQTDRQTTLQSSVLAIKIDRIVYSNDSVDDSCKHQMAVR